MFKIKKIVLCTLLALLAVSVVRAQDKVEATLGTDVVSAYLWRGQKNGSFSIQPTASLSWKGLSLGAWGSFAISPTHNGTDEELDITINYENKGFHVGLTDYFLYNNGLRFFRYRNNDTAHTFEASFGYDSEHFSACWFTNVAGADGCNGSGKRAYSSYLQLDGKFQLVKLDWTATLGVVPYATDYYVEDRSHGFHVNTIALRAEYPLEIRQYKLPIYAQLMANPSSGQLHYMIGFTITAL